MCGVRSSIVSINQPNKDSWLYLLFWIPTMKQYAEILLKAIIVYLILGILLIRFDLPSIPEDHAPPNCPFSIRINPIARLAGDFSIYISKSNILNDIFYPAYYLFDGIRKIDKPRSMDTDIYSLENWYKLIHSPPRRRKGP